MSVTQNYTIDTSSAAWQYIVIAVMTQLRADRKQIERLPAVGHDDFLLGEIALGSEALAALNSGRPLTREDTHGALEGQNLRTAIMALHFMLHALNSGPFASVSDVLSGQVIASPDALNEALLFLENPK